MTPTHKPLTALHVRPAIETSLFDFFQDRPRPFQLPYHRPHARRS